MSAKQYRVAKTFLDDHLARDRGETTVILSENKLTYLVALDAEAFIDLLSDAHYYHDGRDEMIDLAGICRSAKRVMDVLIKQGPPDGYCVQRRGYSFVLIDERTGERV